MKKSNISVTCFKCGKEKVFESVSSIWTAGWVPITKDQYNCEHCCQLEYSDNLNNLSDIITDTQPHNKAPKKIKHIDE